MTQIIKINEDNVAVITEEVVKENKEIIGRDRMIIDREDAVKKIAYIDAMLAVLNAV